jgi:tetratricopeptide (TPR) repeat protein
MNNLANLYHAQGKWAEGEALQLEAFEVKRRILGPEHRDTLISMGNLANTYATEGKYIQAEPLFKRALEVQLRLLGPEHLDTLYTLSVLALMYQRQGKYALAETHATELLARSRHAWARSTRTQWDRPPTSRWRTSRKASSSMLDR